MVIYQTAWRHNPEERNITISVKKTSRVVSVGNVACIGEKLKANIFFSYSQKRRDQVGVLTADGMLLPK